MCPPAVTSPSPRGRAGRVAACWVAAFLTSWSPAAAEASLPVDCLPDEVILWQAAEPDPDLRFGAAFLPGIVLGPPGDSIPTQGSTSVASLGHGGSVVLALRDTVIEDRAGPDFIVFENPFFIGAAPASPGDSFLIFAEPGRVEVSPDGSTWVEFPFDPAALDEARGASVDQDLYVRLQGLAGVTPTFTGNWIVPDDPSAWDPGGIAGISGAGGDAFDLATVGLSEARFIRITDAEAMNGAPGAAEGFDLDAVVVLHGRPVPPAAPDTDGDRLPDLAEVILYGTDPGLADSDGDGIDDGREVAGCSDPGSLDPGPAPVLEPRVWILDGGCSEVRWTFLGSGVTYDVIRGDLADLAAAPSSVDLGGASCLAGGHPTVRWSCESATPLAGEGLFFLVRAAGAGLGWSSELLPREGAAVCP